MKPVSLPTPPSAYCLMHTGPVTLVQSPADKHPAPYRPVGGLPENWHAATWHVVGDPQDSHARPKVPHAVEDVPETQLVPLQQPVGQELESHVPAPQLPALHAGVAPEQMLHAPPD